MNLKHLALFLSVCAAAQEAPPAPAAGPRPWTEPSQPVVFEAEGVDRAAFRYGFRRSGVTSIE